MEADALREQIGRLRPAHGFSVVAEPGIATDEYHLPGPGVLQVLRFRVINRVDLLMLEPGSIAEGIARVASEMRAEVLEEAVLMNAEGWQSQPLRRSIEDIRGPEDTIRIRVWMDMEPHRG